MGQLLIAPAHRSGFIDPLNQTLAAHGLPATVDQTIGDWRLVIHQRSGRSNTAVTALPNGDVAAHIGAFLYHGAQGEHALRQFHAAFDPDAPSWAGCLGHFALVLVKQGQLYLATDALGSFHLYHDDRREVFSSAFTSVLESLAQPTPDPAGMYEYAWNGATFGTKTIFKDINLLSAPSIVSFGGQVQVETHARPLDIHQQTPAKTLQDAADGRVDALRTIFKSYGALGPRPFRSALSGGFDSRLILAALLDAGIDPDLFVFGPDDDPDVQCASALATGEGLHLRHQDKARHPLCPPDAFEAQATRDLYMFDGLKYDGLFNAGADFDDRIARHTDDGVVLNGSVGEIYRNFFYLPDGPMPLRKLVWSFFSQFDPRAMTAAFSIRAYEETLIEAMQKVLNTSNTRVSRTEIEALYPLFRGRFWSARDTSINQRFGWMLYPFLEPQAIATTPALPQKWKQDGRLEAEMIRQLSPRLAGYDSVYGRPFDQPVPLSHRLGTLLSLYRPAVLRRFTYRIRHRGGAGQPPYLTGGYLASIMDPTAPFMRRLFRLGRIADTDTYNRIMTLEWLCQRYNATDINRLN